MSFPRYAEYKDSGVEWLGEVPAHWEVHSLKRRFLIIGGSTPKSDIGTFWDGDIVWVTPADLGQDSFFLIKDSQRKISTEGLASCGTSLVPAGSILLSTRAPIGSLAIAGIELCTNQGCKSLIPDMESFAQFYSYFLSIATGELNIRGKGTTFVEISADALGAFPVSFPPLSEQSTIAAFLDRETGKIDALVAEQEKLIALLKEKRQAVISHAVTKGLDPTVSMKNTTIEWLGEIPEHWKVCLLKRTFRSVAYGISDPLAHEGEVAILRMGNIDGGKISIDDLKFTSSVDNSLLLKNGDLLYNRTNSLELVGKVGLFTQINTSPTSFASYLVRLRTWPDAEPKYFSYLLNTSAVLGEARSYAFVAIGQCNLNPTRYGQIVVAIPPGKEQSKIADHLDFETAKLDALVTEAQHAIDLLKERRSALISVAVTGKIDVRQFVKQAQPSAELVPA